MNLFTFKGGVHPPYRKEHAKDSQIEIAAVPDQLVVPLVQHIGAPCAPAVEAGGTVKEGQVIGQSDAFVSAPIHAPVSGKVKRIERALHPLGQKVLSVFIEPDGADEKEYLKPLGDTIDQLSSDDMKKRVMEAGIVGLGGATFPSHVKFSPPKDKPIEVLIINGCECEPYLTADYRLMLEKPGDIILGAQMIGKILGAKEIVVAVEDNKPDAFKKFKESDAGKGIRYVLTHTKYPQGGEKMLIKAVLKREVPSGGLPMDVGVVVSNVGTALAVCEAVRDGKPLIDRVLTITGNGIKKPGNYIAKIGTPVSSIIEQSGGTVGTIGKLIVGGPMMGIAQSSYDVPVIKGTSGILLLQDEKYMKEGHLPCIKCSFCVQVCPTQLLPSRLSILAEAEKWELMEQFGVDDCIECGSCSYVCPSKRPIVQLIKTAKLKVRDIKARENK
ncbi:MAG: electron transport complex subunit RsxC [Spirochaetota bacterium]|nr:MAG: electron transport complex subunit RsxC [Spirochaetota bacterium]